MTSDASPATTDEVAAANAAHRRAMSPPRLLDCGMSHADIAELDRRLDDGQPWDLACEQIGAARFATATAESAAGHRVSALHRFADAAGAFLFAQMAINADTPRKAELYQRFDDAVGGLAALTDPPMQRLEIPFGDAALTGWHVRPARAPIGTVIVFGGQSGWGAAYLRNAAARAERGIATILAEGPGQGDSRIRHGVYLDVDVAAAFSRFVDAATSLVDGPVGIWGNSVGGLFAALTAAADPRIVACCVNGGFAHPRLLGFRTYAEQAAAMLGTDDPEAITANFDRLAFDPAVHRIDGALLVLHGGLDPLVDLADQQPFLDAARRADLRVWEDGDHTIYNHGDERNDFVADWFAARFADAEERR